VPWLPLALGLLAACGVGLVWGWFEAGWLRTRTLDVDLPRVGPELDGFRIAHLSDLHLGSPGRGWAACRRAVDWVSQRRPDLVCITGDLVSHPRGEPLLRELLDRIGSPFLVLGNHDIAVTRDPFAAKTELDDLREAVLLEDASADVQWRGRRVQLVGVDPRAFRANRSRPSLLADPDADLRILLCHYPRVVRRLPEGAFDLVLSGHMHAGQIVLPYPGGRIALAHPRAREVTGLYRIGSTVLHVSPGLGTTFVPFRFFARPEATELVLRNGGGAATRAASP
jgi:predicted MPP superfamily phosphohydrolase